MHSNFILRIFRTRPCLVTNTQSWIVHTQWAQSCCRVVVETCFQDVPKTSLNHPLHDQEKECNINSIFILTLLLDVYCLMTAEWYLKVFARLLFDHKKIPIGKSHFQSSLRHHKMISRPNDHFTIKRRRLKIAMYTLGMFIFTCSSPDKLIFEWSSCTFKGKATCEC